MAKQTFQVKFPVLNDIEFFDVIKDKKTLKSFTGRELNGKKWREVSEMIGSLLGGGTFRYVAKFTKSNEIYNGSIRAVNVTDNKQIEKNNSAISNQIQDLTNQIQELKKGNNSNIGFDVLMNVTKQGYDTQINFLNSQIQHKEIIINKLEAKIEDQENELATQDQIIDDLKSKTGISQYISIVQDILKVKTGNVNKLNLKDSNTSDIPSEILQLLGLVDWSQVPREILEQTINYLNMFIPKLPLKQ